MKTNNNTTIQEPTPREIVEELNVHIIGQIAAKRAVAVAVRNRWRRRQLPEVIQKEVSPKNILLIGPTGVGKTELARRLAHLTNAPFVKVEATKYTEVGYYGRDVESMVRDLVENAISLVRNRELESIRAQAEKKVEEELLDLLMPLSEKKECREETEEKNEIDESLSNVSVEMEIQFPDDFPEFLREELMKKFPGSKIRTGKSNLSGSAIPTITEMPVDDEAEKEQKNDEVQRKELVDTDRQHFQYLDEKTGDEAKKRSESLRETLREHLRAGLLDEREVTISIRKKQTPPFMMMNISSSSLESGLSDMLGNLVPSKTVKRTLKVKDARKVLTEKECATLLDEEKIQATAIELAENSGIIFLDEIDKIVASNTSRGADVSRQGVQRDLLPIVEGTTIQTRYGYVKTDYILFIAAGAFHQNKPGDLMPELQGRFPIRVELEELSREDFYRILREPENSLLRQYQALIEAEGVHVEFLDDAVASLAEYAWRVNQMTQNIGARRLYTILERLLEDISFNATELEEKNIQIDADYVAQKLKSVTQDEDLSRFIL